VKYIGLFAMLSVCLLSCQAPASIQAPPSAPMVAFAENGNYTVQEMDFEVLNQRLTQFYGNESPESLSRNFPFLKSYVQNKQFAFLSATGLNAEKAPQIEVYKIDSLMDISDQVILNDLKTVNIKPLPGNIAAGKSNFGGRFVAFAYAENGDYLGFCMTSSTELIEQPSGKPLDSFYYACDQEPQTKQNPMLPSNLATTTKVWRPLWSNKVTVQRVSAQTFSPKKMYYILDQKIGPFLWEFSQNQSSKFYSPKTQKTYTWVKGNAASLQNSSIDQVIAPNLVLENQAGFLIADK
jgi:hypothetical protein